MDTIARVFNTRFDTKFHARWLLGLFVCVGLDPDPKRLPVPYRDGALSIKSFVIALIHATKAHAGCYKLNFGAYLRFGPEGLEALEEIIMIIRRLGIPFILDCKFGDIGNSNVWYADYVLNRLDADAVTWHPTLGRESFDDMLGGGKYDDRKIFVLDRTSNKGGAEFQNVIDAVNASKLRGLVDGASEANANKSLEELASVYGWSQVGESIWHLPNYQYVALSVSAEWGEQFGLVVGATAPDELKLVRSLTPRARVLYPGVGKQGGLADYVAEFGCDEDGLAVINVSSDICQPKSDSPLYIEGEPHFEGVTRRVITYNEIIATGLARRAK